MPENKLSKLFSHKLFSHKPAPPERRLSLAAPYEEAHNGPARSDRLLFGGSRGDRDRTPADRREALADALEAWRVNPLARRIVELTTQYVVGSGLAIESRHPRSHAFLQEWWNHRLNHMPTRVFEWCDELSRSGELFILVSTDPAGMSYLRAIPAADVEEIETAPNDVEQELYVWERPDLSRGTSGSLRGRGWAVYNEQHDARQAGGGFQPVVLHYAVNRPVGGRHGESDLAPLLRWLVRYAAWLEDRARLNRYRNTFLYVVKAKFRDKAEKLTRQAELNAHPPNPGAILVADESESWEILSPKLESHAAGEDGLALKKMIAAGSGNPLHFLAEPESATRTTAESAGGPTFRHYQQRQLFFLLMLEDLARVVLRRRKQVDRRVNPKAEVRASGTDISARDNAALATAAATIAHAFGALRDRALIDDAELLRLAYRFAGEVVDVNEMLARGSQAGPGLSPAAPGGVKIKPVEVNPVSGEVAGGESV